MNIINYSRRLAQGVFTLVLLFVMNYAYGQCSIGTSASPILIQLTLDPTTGTAQLAASDISAFIFTNPACDPLIPSKIRFYANASKTTPLGTYVPPGILCSGGGSRIDYTCADVTPAGTYKTVWVAINDGDFPDGGFVVCGEYDAASESEAVEIRVTVVDKTGPDAVAPANAMANANASCTATGIPGIGMTYKTKAMYTGAAGTYTDNCTALNVTYELSGATTLAATVGTNAGVATFNKGITVVKYTITDAGYTPGVDPNPVTVSFTVTVVDATVPTVTCPGPTSRNTQLGVCNYTILGTEFDAVISDNCPVPAGNISCQLAGATSTGGFTPTNTLNNVVLNKGVTNISWKVVDGAGLMTTCGPFAVTVTDNQAPVLAGVPASQSIGTSTAAMTPAACDGSLTWTHPTFTDNCSPLSFPPASLTMELTGVTTAAATSVTPGSSLTQTFNGLGATTITYIATDNNGRTASASFTVTVIDNTAPSVTFANQTYTVNAAAMSCSELVQFTRPSLAGSGISDCSGTFTLTETVAGPETDVLDGYPPFDPNAVANSLQIAIFPVGTTTITYTYSDGAMPTPNTVIRTVTVTVVETEAPVAKCVTGPVTIALDGTGNATLQASTIDNGSTDNCAINTITVAPATFGCAQLGTTVPVVLTVKDFNMNTSTCTSSVKVVDNIAPVVTCPANLTVSTGMGCAVTGITAGSTLVATDNCAVGPITWATTGVTTTSGTGTNLALVSFAKGNTDVTFTVKDNSVPANQTTCTFKISVIDDIDPTLTVTTTPSVPSLCSGGVIERTVNTVFCNYIPTAPLWTVAASDLCSGVGPVSVVGGGPSTTYPQGDTPLTISVVDGAGNISTCNFTVRIKESTKPNAICKDTTVNLNTAPVVVGASSFNNGSTDNCTLGTALTLALVSNDLMTVIPGINVATTNCTDIPVVLRVSDFNNNWDTCHAKVKILDNINPICSVSTPMLALNASGMATLTAAMVNNSSTDNCALHATTPYVIAKTAAELANNQTSLTFGCNELGARVVYFKVTDKSGNTCTTTTTVTVSDLIAPVGNGPADIALSCDEIADYLTIPVTISAVENCTYSVSVVSVSAPIPLSSPTCANHYQLVRSWTVTDVANNTDLVQQIITVEDYSKPTITLPANVTLNLSATPGNCAPTASYSAVVTDDCAGAVTTTWEIDYPGTAPVNTAGTGLVATPVGGFGIGVNKITFRATDACGNSITAAMTVTVVDNVAPVFASYNLPTTLTSYCNHAPFVYSNTPGTCGYTFNWVRPWVGDLSDCSSFTFATESIVAVTPTGTDILSANFPWDQNNSLTEFVPVSISLPVGTTTFKYTATDAAGNVQNCSFNVQVKDTEAPSLSGIQTAVLASICPTQTVPDYRGQLQINDNCPANVSLTQAIVSPNNIPWVAGVTTLAQVFSPATPLDNATFVVRISATDGVNAIATRDITVNLDDNVAPVPNVTNLPATNSNCGYIILPTPTAKTNDCGPGSGATVFGTPGGVSAVSETVNTMGNITSYRVTLPPNPGQPTCQTYFITWSYNDGNGNVATQPQTVTVCPDLIAPTAKCKTTPVNVTLNPTTATLAVTDVDGGSFDTDNCGTFTLGLNKTNFTCADVSPNNTGFTTVVLTATATGNATQTDTCHARIRVIDNIAPVINAATVPASFVVDTCAIGYVLPVAATVTATDNCSATVSLVQTSTQGTSGAAKYNYVVTRTWTATDVFGNTSTAQQTITVKDTKKPVFATLAPASLMFNTALVTNNCSANTVFKVANYISDCAPDNELSIVVNPAYYSLTDTSEVLSVGSHTISFTVTDPSGNSATSTVTIVVKDATKPIASCINGISVALNANGQAIVIPVLVNNQSYDNCSPINTSNGSLLLQELDASNGDTIGNPASQLVFDCLEADNDTEYPIILWVKDAAGNFNFCETYVVIQDNVAPTLNCPPAKTIECSNNPAAFLPAALGNATATDNCPATLTLTYTDTPVNPGYLCGNRVRTFKTTDLSGNVATCTQVITVTDNKPPVFTTLPQNDTILCNDPLVVAPTLSAIDNCTPTDSIKITLVQTKSDSVGICGKYKYKVTRKWTATDKCGNTNMHTQVVTVRDTLGPVFLGMPDTLKILTGNFAPSTNCTAPVAFNAAQFFSECALLSECTINSVVFKPALTPPLTPTMLNISGNYPIGNTKVIFTVTDPCGNVGKDSIVINVKDNSAPVMVCNNTVEIALSNNGQATLTPADVDLNTNDNCGIATRTLSKTLFDCEDLGVNQVTLTATDIYGNANSCTVAVEVTAGPNTGFTLTTSSVVPTYFGATNGSATATATGGSGNFTYKWSTNATTASVTGLAAGAYTVTVTDAFTGCKQTATVTLADGPQVLFTVGNATGAQNTTVKVPVTVTNFQQLSGFTFSLNVPNATVGTIATPALSNVTAALGTGLQTSVSGNTVSVLYLNPQGVNINLPNGTVLFNLCVQLSGASLGSSSPVNIENSPVQFTVIRATANGPLVIPSDAAVNGSVQITQGLNDYDLGGDIYPWQTPTTGVPNVAVKVTGPTTPLTSTTTTAGTYLFSSIVANTNTTTTATKSQAGNTKIDIIDQGLMLKHIFATATNPSPLTSPYQRVAADVNFDGQINIVDFALVQRLLLGTVQHIEGPNAKDWVFIPKSYAFPTSATTAFPNPTYPALPVYPQSITHNPLIQDQLDDDLVAVRIGDLNGDAPLNIQQPATDDRSGNTLKFRLDEQSIDAGNTVSLAFKAKDFTNKKGYQFTFAFDPNVFELQDIEAGVVPGLDVDGNFGTTLLSEGFLSTAWVNLDAVTIEDDATLFTLVFKALENVNELSQVLNISNEVVSPVSVDANDEVAGVELEFTAAVTSTVDAAHEKMVVYQNQPNPFRAETTIGFRLPTSDRTTIRVYTANGRLVKTIIGDFEKGYNSVQVRKGDLGSAGVFWYEVTSGAFSDRKKMIIID